MTTTSERPAWLLERPPAPPAGESATAFIQRHGGHEIQEKPPFSRILLPSGATMTPNDQSRTEPPADAHQKMLRQRVYFALHLRRTQADRKHLDAAMKGYTEPFRWPEKRYGTCPPTGEAALDFLDALIAEDVDALTSIDAELNPNR